MCVIHSASTILPDPFPKIRKDPALLPPPELIEHLLMLPKLCFLNFLDLLLANSMSLSFISMCLGSAKTSFPMVPRQKGQTGGGE